MKTATKILLLSSLALGTFAQADSGRLSSLKSQRDSLARRLVDVENRYSGDIQDINYKLDRIKSDINTKESKVDHHERGLILKENELQTVREQLQSIKRLESNPARLKKRITQAKAGHAAAAKRSSGCSNFFKQLKSRCVKWHAAKKELAYVTSVKNGTARRDIQPQAKNLRQKIKHHKQAIESLSYDLEELYEDKRNYSRDLDDLTYRSDNATRGLRSDIDDLDYKISRLQAQSPTPAVKTPSPSHSGAVTFGCTQNRLFCVGDKVRTRKGFTATVVGFYNSGTLRLKFTRDTINVAQSKIAVNLTKRSQISPSTPAVSRGSLKTSGCVSNGAYCVNDFVQTKKGFTAKVVGYYNEGTLRLKFQTTTLNVAQNKIAVNLTKNF